MNALHLKALRTCVRRLAWIYMVRAGVRGATVWLFLWGAAVLVARISRAPGTEWLSLGFLGVLPAAMVAGWRARAGLPDFVRLRAGYDRWNGCGGVVMSEEIADMSAWQTRPPAATPQFRWRGAPALRMLAASALFAAAALLLPERLRNFGSRPSLEIGRVAGQLQAEVQALRQEKIIGDKKAADLQEQLSQIKADSSGLDPDKTWEALDHVKESNSDAARQAAEEALAKTAAMTEAESLALGMRQAADAGLSPATAAQAARELAGMIAAARLEDGLMNSKIPPELLSGLAGLNGLDQRRLEKLLAALELNKKSLALTAADLARLKLVDPSMLARCNLAGQCHNTNALAAYLCSCTNGCSSDALANCMKPGRGGPGGGGPEAPMTWSDGSSEKDLGFKEHPLAPSSQLSDSQLAGVSRAAPSLAGQAVLAGHGALASAKGSGGAAHARTVLPEHRQAVREFFKREEN